VRLNGTLVGQRTYSVSGPLGLFYDSCVGLVRPDGVTPVRMKVAWAMVDPL
jgi:hypothetical protein